MLNLLVAILSLDFGVDSIMNEEQEQAFKRAEYGLCSMVLVSLWLKVQQWGRYEAFVLPKEEIGSLCIPCQNMAINLFGLMEFNGMRIIAININVLKK